MCVAPRDLSTPGGSRLTSRSARHSCVPDPLVALVVVPRMELLQRVQRSILSPSGPRMQPDRTQMVLLCCRHTSCRDAVGVYLCEDRHGAVQGGVMYEVTRCRNSLAEVPVGLEIEEQSSFEPLLGKDNRATFSAVLSAESHRVRGI